MPNTAPDLSLMDFSDTGQLQKGLGKTASANLTEGGKASGAGLDAFMPLLKHFQKIVSGDASEIDQEAATEIGGVKNAYQAARETITNFSPRGGGLTSSIAANRTGEASDIAKVRSSVRSDASTNLEKIAGALLQVGVSEKNTAISDFGNLLQAAMKQDENSASLWGKIGGTIGAVAGSILFPPAAPALLGGAVSLWGSGGGGGGSAPLNFGSKSSGPFYGDTVSD